MKDNGGYGGADGAPHNFAMGKSVGCILPARPDLADSSAVRGGLQFLAANRNTGTRAWGYKVDERHTWAALACVERNPVRAALAEKAEEYRWSTAAAHCREDALDGRLELEEWRRRFTGERGREPTRRGSPLGSEAFVERVGHALGRDLDPRPPGPPPRQRQTAELTLPVTG